MRVQECARSTKPRPRAGRRLREGQRRPARVLPSHGEREPRHQRAHQRGSYDEARRDVGVTRGRGHVLPQNSEASFKNEALRAAAFLKMRCGAGGATIPIRGRARVPRGVRGLRAAHEGTFIVLPEVRQGRGVGFCAALLVALLRRGPRQLLGAPPRRARRDEPLIYIPRPRRRRPGGLLRGRRRRRLPAPRPEPARSHRSFEGGAASLRVARGEPGRSGRLPAICGCGLVAGFAPKPDRRLSIVGAQRDGGGAGGLRRLRGELPRPHGALRPRLARAGARQGREAGRAARRRVRGAGRVSQADVRRRADRRGRGAGVPRGLS
mmetsp:Transcript_12020/g.35967  ORF Transcript_12020/g.35967 Transcript_12020/m.35967 type:complete len:323 (+) Transcript_12020:381-1349(+)